MLGEKPEWDEHPPPGCLAASHRRVSSAWGRHKQDERLAIAIGDGMKIGIQAAFRAPDTTGNSPFYDLNQCADKSNLRKFDLLWWEGNDER